MRLMLVTRDDRPGQVWSVYAVDGQGRLMIIENGHIEWAEPDTVTVFAAYITPEEELWIQKSIRPPAGHEHQPEG